jgi:predicted nuclease of restriction endonuclease-like (RecB) superfamily
MNKELTSNKEYVQWFSDIKIPFRSAQQKAALRVNQELLSLYWQIGEALAIKETEWGDKFIGNLTRDFKVEFPDATGYSKRNLEKMRRWYQFYTEHLTIAQQLVAQIPSEVKGGISQQAIDLHLYNLLLNIPWGHHTLILSKIKNVA